MEDIGEVPTDVLSVELCPKADSFKLNPVRASKMVDEAARFSVSGHPAFRETSDSETVARRKSLTGRATARGTGVEVADPATASDGTRDGPTDSGLFPTELKRRRFVTGADGVELTGAIWGA